MMLYKNSFYQINEVDVRRSLVKYALEQGLRKYLRELFGIFLIVILCLFTTARDLSAETKNNFVELQSGSMQGLIHLSYGWIIADLHLLSLGLGYVPELENHHKLFLLGFKYRFHGTTIYKLKKIGPDISFSPIIFGITGIVANNRVLFTRLTKPGKIPDDYYHPTGERYFVNYQPQIQLSKTLGIYADFSIIDIGLVNYIRNFDFYVDNYNYFGLEGIVNWGIGMRVKF